MDNVVLTPHTASATEEARSKMAEVAAQKYYRGAGRKSAAKLDKIVKLVILAVMLKLNTELRNVFGKKLKNDRKEGKLPAVVYGKGKESKALFVNLNEFKKIWNKIEEVPQSSSFKAVQAMMFLFTMPKRSGQRRIYPC